jgi:drug/metabolite transporter (DMT)-like permease
LFGKHRERPASLFMTSSMQMLCGGLELLLLSCALGEPAQLQHVTVSREVWFALGYLVVFGSWLGFGSYVWLLARVSTTRLSTYAFVNPLVAVVLGAWLLHEPFSARLAGPALLILAGVAIVQLPARAAVSGGSSGTKS